MLFIIWKERKQRHSPCPAFQPTQVLFSMCLCNRWEGCVYWRDFVLFGNFHPINEEIKNNTQKTLTWLIFTLKITLTVHNMYQSKQKCTTAHDEPLLAWARQPSSGDIWYLPSLWIRSIGKLPLLDPDLTVLRHRWMIFVVCWAAHIEFSLSDMSGGTWGRKERLWPQSESFENAGQG